jgi:hypothetical protein
MLQTNVYRILVVVAALILLLGLAVFVYRLIKRRRSSRFRGKFLHVSLQLFEIATKSLKPILSKPTSKQSVSGTNILCENSCMNSNIIMKWWILADLTVTIIKVTYCLLVERYLHFWGTCPLSTFNSLPGGWRQQVPLVPFCQRTLHHIPEDSRDHSYHQENLKSHMVEIMFAVKEMLPIHLC